MVIKVRNKNSLGELESVTKFFKMLYIFDLFFVLASCPFIITDVLPFDLVIVGNTGW